jgi:hypothetical protein
MQPAVGVQIGVHRDQLALHRNAPDKVKEKGFPGPIFAYNDPEGGAAVSESIYVFQKRVQFTCSTHLNKMLARTRDYTGSQ